MESSNTRLPPPAYLWTIVGAFFLWGFLIYGSSLHNDFVRWDDGLLIYDNAIVRTFDIVGAFTSYDPELYIPLTFLSYQIDYVIGGVNPEIYHLTNLVLHVLTSLCVSWFVYVLSRKGWIALACGLLFLAHPLHTEAVAWASARKDLLSTLFALLSLIFYVRAQNVSFALRKENMPLYASMFFFLLALLAKVTVVTLPVILVLIHWYRGGAWRRKEIHAFAPYIGLSVLFGIIAIFGKTSVIAHSTPLEKILMACMSTVFYLKQIVAPSHLSVLYPYTQSIGIASPDFLLPIGILCVLFGASFFLYRKTRLPLFALTFFILCIAPSFINFSKGDGDIYFASDRYAYMGSIGIFFLVLMAVDRFISRRMGMIPTAVIISLPLIGSSVYAHAQSLVWSDTATLFQNALASYPDSYVARNNLGNHYRRIGDSNAAIQEFTEAMRIKPQYKVLNNLASTYRSVGRTDEAIALYNRSIESHSENAAAYLGLGIIHAQAGNVPEALNMYSRAIQIDPRFDEALLNRGALYAATGDYDAAIEEYKKAAEVNPYLPQSYFNLGVAYAKINRMRDSLESYEKAVELQPAYVAARINLGIQYYERKRFEDAKNQFETVLKYDPENAQAKAALGQMNP